jgi:hypothetical protein
MSTNPAARTVCRNVTYIATPADLMQYINGYRNQGALVAMTLPEPAEHDGYYRTVLRVRVPYDPATERAARTLHTNLRRSQQTRRTRPGKRIAVIAVTVTGTIAGLAAIGAFLIGQLVEAVTAHAGQILAVLALVAVIATAITRRSKSDSGRHCPGC